MTISATASWNTSLGHTGSNGLLYIRANPLLTAIFGLGGVSAVIREDQLTDAIPLIGLVAAQPAHGGVGWRATKNPPRFLGRVQTQFPASIID